jgi:lipopolysaccharide transport system ATP-binding protein
MTALQTNRPIVEIEGVSKRYKVGSLGPTSIGNALRALLPGRNKSAPTQDFGARTGDLPGTFWSLKDVSFSVNRGEIVGLIGRNGAGKSTLLKLLSRITEPTKGRITLRGRIASLLEVGTGFHPELTGRENIFLNGAILGMKRWEIQAKFNEIVEFSEVGNFLDTPVKRYSSGMFVRLAFAVAAHLEPEILLIDEVLAVGDAGFQQKCLGKMSDVAERGGRTIFFVSHNLGAIRQLCTRAVLIEDGTAKAEGAPEDVIAQYLASSTPERIGEAGRIVWGDGDDAPGVEDIRLQSLTLRNSRGEVSALFDAAEPIHAELCYRVINPIRSGRMTLSLYTTEGDLAFVMTDHELQESTITPGRYRTEFIVPGGVLNRRIYSFSPCCDAPGYRNLMGAGPHLQFTVGGTANHHSQFPERWPGTVCPRVETKVEKLA